MSIISRTRKLELTAVDAARIDIETMEIGEKVYLSGNPAGIAPGSWILHLAMSNEF